MHHDPSSDVRVSENGEEGFKEVVGEESFGMAGGRRGEEGGKAGGCYYFFYYPGTLLFIIC